MDEILEVRECFLTGDFTSIMPSHSTSQSNDKTVGILCHELGLISVTAQQLVISQHHVFVITPDTTYTAGCC